MLWVVPQAMPMLLTVSPNGQHRHGAVLARRRPPGRWPRMHQCPAGPLHSSAGQYFTPFCIVGYRGCRSRPSGCPADRNTPTGAALRPGWQWPRPAKPRRCAVWLWSPSAIIHPLVWPATFVTNAAPITITQHDQRRRPARHGQPVGAGGRQHGFRSRSAGFGQQHQAMLHARRRMSRQSGSRRGRRLDGRF